MNSSVPFLEVCGITKTFKQKNNTVEALKPISFKLQEAEILAIIGESGSGKSTLLKLLTGLERTTNGTVNLLGKDITRLRGKGSKHIYQNMQMIFQNPVASFNPRRKLRSSIIENMRQLRPSLSSVECTYEIDRLLEKVGIPSNLADRYPQHLSGGQCQRIAIARALSIQPKILLCDEITSALDVLVQAQVMDLLRELSRDLGIAIVFVSHDLSLTCNFCERVIVMHQGYCVETGSTNEIIDNPKHTYTKQLLAASIDPITSLETERVIFRHQII
ncbi:ABC transporter related [Alkaliphilus metalliredigens QYMF]|uniref:ABC transporter related n=1 Tax=Alkaliphilus metalliredigens (strain QYMF) TaxID=293826 RepID=A6TPU2_ALKMQ|nr:ATP-binding cassette domain-containing protein [Alkaliphilus metalliredigens]ABR48210.1 ABC transporter related [Alkaliphilus metalliredigens QYMF]